MIDKSKKELSLDKLFADTERHFKKSKELGLEAWQMVEAIEAEEKATGKKFESFAEGANKVFGKSDYTDIIE